MAIDITYLISTTIAVSGAIIAITSYRKTTVEKERIKVDAEIEKERIRSASNVEKERIIQECEVEKVREKSLGAGAVIKIWNEIDELQKAFQELQDFQDADTTNTLIKEIIRRLQEDVARLMDVLFKNFGSHDRPLT